MHLPSFDTFSDSAQARAACEELFTSKFIHVHGVGWLEWTGKVWLEVPDKVPLDALRAWTERKLAAVVDAAAAEGVSANVALVKAWRKRLGAGALWQALTLLRGFPGVSVRPEELDANPDVLNCRNGVVYLPTGDLIPHAPGMYLTKIADTDYKPGAVHEDWTTALTALPTEVADWLLVRFGQAITGHMCPDDRVLIQHGGGENGKTTILEAIANALGDYCFLGSDKILMAGQANAHTTDFADLQGKRLVVLEETAESGRLDVVRLKKVAGTTRITARKMRQDNVSFRATHTLFLSTNHAPHIGETDRGTWRRLLLVTYPYTFVSEPTAGGGQRLKDPRLRERMVHAPQREAALAALVAGAVRWYAGHGGVGRTFPPEPLAVTAATGDWRNATDQVVAFWSDHLDPDPGSYIQSGDLIWMYNQYLRKHGNSEVANSTFTRRFETHPITTAAGVVKQRIRQTDTPLRQSRPYGALDPFGRLGGCPQGQVMVWVGLRFRPSGDLGTSPTFDQRKWEGEQGEQA